MNGQRIITACLMGAAMLSLAACGNKFENNFMAGCTDSGASKSVCNCVYTELKSDFDKAEDDPGRLLSSGFRERRNQAMASCRAK